MYVMQVPVRVYSRVNTLSAEHNLVPQLYREILPNLYVGSYALKLDTDQEQDSVVLKLRLGTKLCLLLSPRYLKAFFPTAPLKK
jgi:hypothetical protein